MKIPHDPKYPASWMLWCSGILGRSRYFRIAAIAVLVCVLLKGYTLNPKPY